MNDAKTMGSLEEKLMSYVSTTPQQDANYDIALAMLTHYGKLKNLSLAEIADLCYVSKASISRFCRFMGFDGFRELHDCLLQDFSIRTDYSRTFYDKLCADPQAALQDYSEEVIRNIRVTTAPENTERLAEMAVALANSGRIAFFSHHFLWDIGRHLQSNDPDGPLCGAISGLHPAAGLCPQPAEKRPGHRLHSGGKLPHALPYHLERADNCWVPHSGHHPEYIQLLLELCPVCAGVRGVQPQRCGQVRGVDGGGSVDPAISASVWKRISLNKLFVSRCRDGHLLFF